MVGDEQERERVSGGGELGGVGEGAAPAAEREEEGQRVRRGVSGEEAGGVEGCVEEVAGGSLEVGGEGACGEGGEGVGDGCGDGGVVGGGKGRERDGEGLSGRGREGVKRVGAGGRSGG